MWDDYNEQYDNQDQVGAVNQLETTLNNLQPVEDFPEIQNTIPGYNGDNKELINNFLHNNSELRQLLSDFFNNGNIKLKDKILCKKNLKGCKTDEDIKNIILELIPWWCKIWVKEEKQEILQQMTTETSKKKAEVEEVKAEAEEKKAEAEEKKAGVEKANSVMKDAKEYRESLCNKYSNLESKTNESSDNYNKVKSDLENNWVLNQLRQDNHDEQFINDYIKVQATLLEFKSNPTAYEEDDISAFDKIVKKLNNSCNIPDTKLSSFDIKNISQTRKELFNEDIWNDSLIRAKASNLESREYPEWFFDMWDEEIIANYWRFLEWASKDFWIKYQNDINFRNETDEARKLNQETDLQVMYDKMLLELKNKKEEMDNRTKELVEELCLVSQIKWMYMCIWEWENFNLNKANEIQSDNWVLTLNGHIDGINFAIRQDTNNPEARLQTSLRLNKQESTDWKSFVIWWADNFVDSNFILPSQNEVFNVVAESMKEDRSLLNSDNQDDYFENLQANIMGKIDEQYEDTKYVHHYMQNQVKWEKIVDTSLWLLNKVKPGIDTRLTQLKSINQANGGKLYEFIKMLNFNIENSTVDEKEKLNACISKIWEISEIYRNNQGKDNWFKYPPIIENYLKSETWLMDWNEDPKLWLIFDLFSYYNQNSKDIRIDGEWNEWIQSKIIINDLYRDLVEFTSNGQSEVASKRENENKEQQDREDAKNIEKAIENMSDGDWS